jgi:L-glyceraldehyde 3-phosphate reductase
MFDRWIENGLLDVLQEEGIGCIAFSPLAQGMLTDRYLRGIPADSRAGKTGTNLPRERVTDQVVSRVTRLGEIASARGQTMAQMALAWVLRQPQVTSALIGASRPAQIDDAAAALNQLEFSRAELESIETILRE